MLQLKISEPPLKSGAVQLIEIEGMLVLVTLTTYLGEPGTAAEINYVGSDYGESPTTLTATTVNEQVEPEVRPVNVYCIYGLVVPTTNTNPAFGVAGLFQYNL